MIGILGIIVALALPMYLAFRGVSVLILGPTMALVAVLIAGWSANPGRSHPDIHADHGGLHHPFFFRFSCSAPFSAS